MAKFSLMSTDAEGICKCFFYLLFGVFTIFLSRNTKFFMLLRFHSYYKVKDKNNSLRTFLLV